MNTDYGKIIDSRIQYAPNPVYLDGYMIANPKPEQYKQAGYKPIRRTDAPREEGYYYTPSYADKGAYILESWERHVEQTDGTGNSV